MYGARPPFMPPYGRRFNADLFGNGATPPLTEQDLQQLWSEGLLPPEFYDDGVTGNGVALSELGQPAERILRSDFDLAKNLPDSPESIVANRGAVGDSFRGLQPLNLGRGTIVNAGDENALIVEARGLDCLTPVGVAIGYNIIQGEVIENTTDLFCQAVVVWGVGGAQHEAVFDVGRGTQIRLPSASYVKIFVSLLPDDSTSPPRTAPPILVSALLGYGTPSFRASPARFTQRISTINEGASSAIVPIPQFAQSFGVIGEKGSIAGWTATLLPALTNDGHGHQAVSILADTQMESAMPIPEGFRALQLNNPLGSGLSQPAEVIYALML